MPVTKFSKFNDRYQHSKINLERYNLIEFARKIANELGYELISYLDSGGYGAAYKITRFRVLKLTTDIREVYTAKMLMNKNTNFIINYYDVKKIESKYLQSELYSLIMDFVFCVKDGEQRNRIFYDYFGFNYPDKKAFFLRNDFSDVSLFLEKYNSDKSILHLPKELIQKNILDLQNLAIETKKIGIYPIDIHSGNVGYKYLDKSFVYFDVGINQNYTVLPIGKLIIN